MSSTSTPHIADVTRVGNLTDDFDERVTPNGKRVASTSLAYEPYDPETKTRGDAVFYQITVWEEMAAHCVDSLHKGDRVIVVGKPSVREWEHEGQHYSRKEITARAIGPDLRFSVATVSKTQPVGAASQESTTELVDF